MYASAGFNPWTPIVVKNVTLLGSQTSPSLTNVSRDGGYSVLLSQRIVWLYDDTECISADGKQLSFVSNTAAYAANLTPNRSTITDFGVVMVGHNQEGFTENALLGNDAVGGGGWIPFDRDELEFNERNKGRQRIAICTLHAELNMTDASRDFDKHRPTMTADGHALTLRRAWHISGAGG